MVQWKLHDFKSGKMSLVDNVLEIALRVVYDDHDNSYSKHLMTKNKPTSAKHQCSNERNL